eukprot:CAMPEP_0184644554 /NCGR_PEP_ID=MMETSP0308-20130426/1247_1 /TAXON_ID=38269 /ORGANISM="Gloeochaete witrockiana, Strain SAG 46.84" /LENGTH=54 /DNA_ID=CAMNT_0027073153 /DNA_START=436 /DNA_END=597 /DNA_ORIENTATION=+
MSVQKLPERAISNGSSLQSAPITAEQSRLAADLAAKLTDIFVAAPAPGCPRDLP